MTITSPDQMSEPLLRDRIRADLNTARKARDSHMTTLLGTILSDLRNREIELGHEVSDEEVESVLSTAIKRRKEAAEQMTSGGRPELAEKELREAEVLGQYLPEQLSEDEVRARVRQAVDDGASNIGEVMQAVMPEVKGRFGGKEVNRIAREELEARG